jgi:hypothetical protein
MQIRYRMVWSPLACRKVCAIKVVLCMPYPGTVAGQQHNADGHSGRWLLTMVSNRRARSHADLRSKYDGLLVVMFKTKRLRIPRDQARGRGTAIRSIRAMAGW